MACLNDMKNVGEEEKIGADSAAAAAQHNNTMVVGAAGISLENEKDATADLAEDMKSLKLNTPSTTRPFHNSALMAKMPKLDIPKFYCRHKIEATVSYISDLNNLEFYVCLLMTSNNKSLQQLSTLCKNALEKHTEPLEPGDLVAAEIDDHIFRAMVINKGWNCELYLLEVGEIIRLKEVTDLYVLPPQYKDIPAQAIFCKLRHNSEDELPSLKELLQASLYKACRFRIHDADKTKLYVELINDGKSPYLSGEVLSDEKDHLEHANDTNSQCPSSKLTSEELDRFMEETPSTTSHMKAIYDHVPQDDHRICRHYDPKRDSCFKGANCKKLHIFKPDGFYTKDVEPMSTVYENDSELIHYQCDERYIVTITAVESFASIFAVHEDEFHKSSVPLMWRSSAIPSHRFLTSPPCVHDLVLAKYIDGYFYRARIVDELEDYRKYLVFFVDYGNKYPVLLRDLAHCEPLMQLKPFRAICFRLANVLEGYPSEDEAREGMQLFQKAVLNKIFTIKIVSALFEPPFIEILDKNVDSALNKLVELNCLTRSETY